MFTHRDLIELMTLVNSAIMKSHFHNGANHDTTKLLYEIRTKLISLEEDNDDGK